MTLRHADAVSSVGDIKQANRNRKKDDMNIGDIKVAADFVDFLRSSVRRSSKGYTHESTIVVRVESGDASVSVVHRERNEHAEYGYLETRASHACIGRVANYDSPRREHLTRYVTSSRRKDAPITLSSLVKTGDTLRVNLLIGNSNETLRAAGLAHDEAYIEVQRNGRLVGSVHIADVVAPTESSARFAY